MFPRVLVRIGSLPRTDTVLGFVCVADVHGRAMA